MNQRDRLFIQREWIAWADWVRQGQTCPNTLGYKSSTVEHGLMSGDTGGVTTGNKVPTRFNHDENVEKLNRLFWRFHVEQQRVMTGIYCGKSTERTVAHYMKITRHRVRQLLHDSYLSGFHTLTTTEKRAGIVSA